MMVEGEEGEGLLVKRVEDIKEDWVVRLLQHNLHHTTDGKCSVVSLKKWSRGQCFSTDDLAGFSSSRATIRVEYEVEGEAELRVETYVVKLIPTEGYMAGLLTSEGMHHIEVGQYGRFLRTLGAWERARRGVGVVEEIVPPHALALSTPDHFTLVLPEITHLGYHTNNISEGLQEDHILTVAHKLGTLHGTAVAYKVITGTHLPEAFPRCFLHARVESRAFSVFAKTGFQRLREDWTGEASKAHLLERLAPYEVDIPLFVVSGLVPREPFATIIHGDLQPSNIFFKRTTTDGQYTIKVIDWATAHYSQGPIDLAYMLNIGVDTEVRRKVTTTAKDVYFNAFNAALTDLNAHISYPREVFEEQYANSRRLLVVWSIMSINIFFSSQHLKDRLTAIISDILLDPTIQPPPPPSQLAV